MQLATQQAVHQTHLSIVHGGPKKQWQVMTQASSNISTPSSLQVDVPEAAGNEATTEDGGKSDGENGGADSVHMTGASSAAWAVHLEERYSDLTTQEALGMFFILNDSLLAHE